MGQLDDRLGYHRTTWWWELRGSIYSHRVLSPDFNHTGFRAPWLGGAESSLLDYLLRGRRRAAVPTR